MPSCELCGRTMKGRGRNVTIEGAEMIVCPQCASRFASQPSKSSSKMSVPQTQPSWTRSSTSYPTSSTSKPPMRTAKKKLKPRSEITLDDMMLIENYAEIIRNARQKAKLTQDELAQKVGERVSTLQAIESGRLKPTKKTLRGLERELEISLLEPIDTVPIKPTAGTRGGEPTLGDRVIIKRKKSQKSK
jgi:putative transcription factor